MPTRLRTGGAADAPRRIDTTQDHAAASKYALSHFKPLDLLKKPKAHFDAHQIYRWWGRASLCRRWRDYHPMGGRNSLACRFFRHDARLSQLERQDTCRVVIITPTPNIMRAPCCDRPALVEILLSGWHCFQCHRKSVLYLAGVLRHRLLGELSRNPLQLVSVTFSCRASPPLITLTYWASCVMGLRDFA